ncbi:MAG: GNAT family N-acetyltransferase [Planctomycetaceae bacterium]
MRSMDFDIAAMQPDDYDDVIALWLRTDRLGLSDADSRENIVMYLARNPGLSIVARRNEMIVGTVLCGHDGRRGYLHHLAVAEEHRNSGIGSALVERSLRALATVGIHKCHIFVVADNAAGIAFWKRAGWAERVELMMLSAMT